MSLSPLLQQYTPRGRIGARVSWELVPNSRPLQEAAGGLLQASRLTLGPWGGKDQSAPREPHFCLPSPMRGTPDEGESA